MTSRIVNQNAKALAELLSADEIDKLLQEARERKQREAEEEKNRARQIAVERISELLNTATNALRSAGDLAAEFDIPFTFVTPKGDTESHSGRWQSSACYPGDGWYYEDDYYKREPNKVDNQPVGVHVDSNWQSSS